MWARVRLCAAGGRDRGGRRCSGAGLAAELARPQPSQQPFPAHTMQVNFSHFNNPLINVISLSNRSTAILTSDPTEISIYMKSSNGFCNVPKQHFVLVVLLAGRQSSLLFKPGLITGASPAVRQTVVNSRLETQPVLTC